jgi:protein-tyrosine phosphatase
VIDLHCHLLPGIDDGARDVETALAMARMAVADGITVTACTPHILPGVYNNTGPEILAAIGRLQDAIAQAGIPLRLISGADVHVVPDLTAQLRSGRALSLNNSRYLLLEPPHHVLPPRMEDYIFGLQTSGFVPIITHPERLSWVESHYELIRHLVYSGNLMQLTAGSLMGRFGRRPRYWAERMLDDGFCHLLASDAHNTEQRAPVMSDARELVARRLGQDEALNLVLNRPQAIMDNVASGQLPPPVSATVRPQPPAPSGWTSMFKRGRRRVGGVR